MKKEFWSKLTWITIFAIAMGYLESAVVVYLRKLYFPDGFDFPLKSIDPSIGLTEFFREAATIFMLIGAGFIAGKNRNEKFAWFIFCFGIWDIFYYVFLKLLLGWPESLLTWDVLFLIPVPWVGPVLAPCLISLAMIILAMTIVVFEAKNITTRIDAISKILIIVGSFICITSFCWDYFQQASAANKMWTPGSEEKLFSEITDYIPQKFNWAMFLSGFTFLLGGIFRIYRESKKKYSHSLT